MGRALVLYDRNSSSPFPRVENGFRFLVCVREVGDGRSPIGLNEPLAVNIASRRVTRRYVIASDVSHFAFPLGGTAFPGVVPPATNDLFIFKCVCFLLDTNRKYFPYEGHALFHVRGGPYELLVDEFLTFMRPYRVLDAYVVSATYAIVGRVVA